MKQLLVLSLLMSSIVSQAILAIDDEAPTIVVRWLDDEKTYQLSDKHIKDAAIFHLFDESFFKQHQLPNEPISYRTDPSTSIESSVLVELIENFIEEVQQHKTEFTHFIVLHDCTFNYKMLAGSLIVKFKNYPFVVKLFMENPHSFVSPFAKGWEPYLHFIMGSGINRHLLGFTRLKNREHILKLLAHNQYWSSFVTIPRKWSFIPADTRWLEVTTINMGSENPQTITMPSTYCIIADAIDIKRMLSFYNANDRQLALALCNYLNLAIDPNTDNFAIEREMLVKDNLFVRKRIRPSLIILDTEYYPSMLGLPEKTGPFNNYVSLYGYLVLKAVKNFIFSKYNNPAARCEA